MYITCLLCFIFIIYFYKYVKLGSGKMWVSMTIGQGKSGNSQGMSIDGLGMNPVIGKGT